MRRFLKVMLPLLILAGCGDDDVAQGPGAITATVGTTGTPLGAVILDLDGVGFQGVHGLGTTQAYFVGPIGKSTFRVVVVSESGGPMRFVVDVDERSVADFVATAVAASDLDDEPIPSVDGIAIRFSR